jgi:hypothetical protein
MGALNSIITPLTQLAGTYTSATNAISTLRGAGRDREGDQALRQLQERQALQQQQTAQSAALEKQRLATEAAQNESKRRAALRRAVARQRASFGAQGIGSGGGSSQAVLLGLFDETEDELAQRAEMDRLRTQALDLDSNQQNSLNLLQTTQLAQRNRLNRLF